MGGPIVADDVARIIHGSARPPSWASRCLWSMRSNAAVKSASRTPTRAGRMPLTVLKIAWIASRQAGRKRPAAGVLEVHDRLGSKNLSPWLTWADAALGHAVGPHHDACSCVSSTSCSAALPAGLLFSPTSVRPKTWRSWSFVTMTRSCDGGTRSRGSTGLAGAPAAAPAARATTQLGGRAELPGSARRTPAPGRRCAMGDVSRQSPHP
jgi:hypothetical protein